MLDIPSDFVVLFMDLPDFGVLDIKNAHNDPHIDAMLDILIGVEHIYALNLPLCLVITKTR
jgi:hypothetical protein